MSVWLIGAGSMAIDYIKVLQGLDCDFTVIGRGTKSADQCKVATGCSVLTGGVECFLATAPMLCSHAIVAVNADYLFSVTVQLLNYGVKNILLEKPGALFAEDLQSLYKLATQKQANIYIAYNRRFYASVLKAQEIIKQDGGVISFNFEFTEWAHVIESLDKNETILKHWLLANSTHVLDLAFHLGGKPKDFSCFTSGGLAWHPSASVFSGAGVTERGALFSYKANWESAGRWGVDVLTKSHRLILQPLEKLQIQNRGELNVEYFQGIDYELDERFKPGLYQQVNNFLANDGSLLCGLGEQCDLFSIYNKIANYA